jgi:Putative adhesin
MTVVTSNGSVHAEDVRGGLNASTSNGSMDLELDTPHISELIVSTSNGGITVRLPAATNLSVTAHTSGHDSIHTDFDVTVHGQLTRSRLDGMIRSGGPRIDLRTSNGNIRLLKI